MLPVKKTSRSRTRTRRAHHALRRCNVTRCPQCSHPKLPHAACMNCGFVNAKVALNLESEEA